MKLKLFIVLFAFILPGCAVQNSNLDEQDDAAVSYRYTERNHSEMFESMMFPSKRSQIARFANTSLDWGRSRSRYHPKPEPKKKP